MNPERLTKPSILIGESGVFRFRKANCTPSPGKKVTTIGIASGAENPAFVCVEFCVQLENASRYSDLPRRLTTAVPHVTSQL